jgi:hypothetical protein
MLSVTPWHTTGCVTWHWKLAVGQATTLTEIGQAIAGVCRHTTLCVTQAGVGGGHGGAWVQNGVGGGQIGGWVGMWHCGGIVQASVSGGGQATKGVCRHATLWVKHPTTVATQPGGTVTGQLT